MITGEQLIERPRVRFGRTKAAVVAAAILVAGACSNDQEPTPVVTKQTKKEAVAKGKDIASTLARGQVYQRAQIMHGLELPIEAECPPEVSEGKFMVSYRAHDPIKLGENIYGYFAPYDKGGKALEIAVFNGELEQSPELTAHSEQTMDVAFISYPSGYDAVVSGAGPGVITDEEGDNAQRIGEMTWQSYREGESCTDTRDIIARFPVDLAS